MRYALCMTKLHPRLGGRRATKAVLVPILALLAFLLAAACAAPPPAPAAAPAAPEPQLREPLFRVSSIRILRDRLVTTELLLGFEVENPNDFPLALESCSWSLEAEGKPWVKGSLGGGSEEPIVAPAGATIVRELEVELNFADSDRRLFDLIARLGSVRYRLRGEALLSAGGGASRTLAARFDVEGSCAVER